MAAFGAALPQIRARIEEDLRLRGLGREKVVATAVRLLEETSVRVGNEEYAKQNDSFGLTTLRDHHVEIEGKTMKFRFKGKSAQEHDIELNDARLAKIVQACQDIPGQELFQFYDPSGEHCRLCSEDVNRYIKEIGGDDFTAKDFRTWNGSREAVLILNEMGPATSATDAKKRIVETVKRVAAKLRNRPATCRKYYIHPAVLEAYQDNTLFEFVEQAKPQEGPYGLDRNEVALLSIIQMNVPKELMRKRRRAA
jgi:DNA topoisomerase-1